VNIKWNNLAILILLVIAMIAIIRLIPLIHNLAESLQEAARGNPLYAFACFGLILLTLVACVTVIARNLNR